MRSGSGRSGGVSRFEPREKRWQTYTQKDGLAGDVVLAIHQSPDGALWFGTFGGGVSRFEPREKRWQTYTQKDGLAGDSIQAIHESPDGALWFGTGLILSGGNGVSRLMREGSDKPGQSGAVLNLKAQPDHTAVLALPPGSSVRSRPGGLVFASLSSGANAQVSAVASAEPIRCLAAGPVGAVWTGERLGGLHVRRADGGDLQLTETQGLPAMDVRVLASVKPDGGTVWAGTGGGAARVAMVKDQLKIERTATYRDGLPTGPVAALAARADGAVFLAYNALDAKWFSTPEYTQRRATSRVYFVPADGPPGDAIELTAGLPAPAGLSIQQMALVPSAEPQRKPSPPTEAQGDLRLAPDTLAATGTVSRRLAQVEIRALALVGDSLWAATSAGLFLAEHPTQPGAELGRVTTTQTPQVPIRTLKTDPKSGALWMIADAQEDVPTRVIGYDPASDRSVTLGEANGIPAGLPLHDLGFTEQGELVVLAGGQLVKGFVSVGPPVWMNPVALSLALVLIGSALALWFTVFRHPLVVRARARPESLAELSLAEIPIALRRLRRAGALNEVWERLGLSLRRLQRLEKLASKATPERMQALAGLLGMNEAPVPEELYPGLWSLQAELGSPAPLSKQPIPLIGIDRQAQNGDDESHARSVILEALKRSEHRFELPFLLFCRDSDLARQLVPEQYVALLIDDALARELLFARDPSQTLAGLLLTRGLLALSPYSEKGAVADPAMFYGRDRVLRELMQSASPQCLLVGPRRVGKTSLLRRLEDQLPKRRPELQPVFLDLLGIDDPTAVIRRLARALKLSAPMPAPSFSDNARLLAEMLRERFPDPARPGLILIDEADGLVEADAASGFPLLSALRSLQAEGLCSFILAGYWYLFRRTLDHGSPVYNFATVKQLRPLEPEAARDLASEPMARIGLRYENSAIPERIAERTGGYPSLIQFLCDQLLNEMKKDRSLVLTATQLTRAEQSQDVRDHLTGFFRFNTGPGAQVLVYRVLERDGFGLAEAHGYLEQAAGRDVPLWVIEQILLQLVLFGLLAESGDRYRWTIPLVRDTLLAGQDRDYRVSLLLKELPADFAAWITPAERSAGSG